MMAYVELTRPRIVTMVLFAVAVTAWSTGTEAPAFAALVQASVGIGLITGGSIAMNEWFEHRTDALMARTAGRPVPSGRTLPRHALAFGLTLSVSGLAYLATFSNHRVALLAAVNWLIYVALYTPLKAVSVWQTPVGAVAGAMPVLLGGSVSDAIGHPLTWSLFALVFLWQFPHAMAIAWLYRDQYAAAGLRLMTVRDPSGRSAAWLSVLGSAALLCLGPIAVVLAEAPIAFGIAALLSGLVYCAFALRFARERDDQRARHLLWVSLAYLPVVLLTLALSVSR